MSSRNYSPSVQMIPRRSQHLKLASPNHYERKIRIIRGYMKWTSLLKYHRAFEHRQNLLELKPNLICTVFDTLQRTQVQLDKVAFSRHSSFLDFFYCLSSLYFVSASNNDFTPMTSQFLSRFKSCQKT